MLEFDSIAFVVLVLLGCIIHTIGLHQRKLNCFSPALYLVIFNLHEHCKVGQVIAAAIGPVAGIVDNSTIFL